MVINNNRLIIRLIIFGIFLNIITIVTFILISEYGEKQWVGWLGSGIRVGTRSTKNCERIRNSFMREKYNSISNIPFILFGEHILMFSIYDLITEEERIIIIKKYPIWSLLYGSTMIYVGISSFIAHASWKESAWTLDVASVYAMLVYFHLFFLLKVIFLYLNKLENINFDNVFKVVSNFFCYLLVIFDFVLFHSKEYLEVFTVAKISFILIIFQDIMFYLLNRSNINKYNVIYSFLTLLFIIVGFILRQNDKNICNPDSIIQLHGVFHVFMSIGLCFAYLMLRTEVIM